MSSHIDFRILPCNLPSLCIPRVFMNIDEKRIRRIFDELNMGEIQRIDVVSKTTDKGEKFNRIFVHFKRWFANETADMARERLLNGKEIKIIYDDPWFWKVSAYREANNAPARPNVEKPTHKKASLQFDSDEEEITKSTTIRNRYSNIDETKTRNENDNSRMTRNENNNRMTRNENNNRMTRNENDNRMPRNENDNRMPRNENDNRMPRNENDNRRMPRNENDNRMPRNENDNRRMPGNENDSRRMPGNYNDSRRMPRNENDNRMPRNENDNRMPRNENDNRKSREQVKKVAPRSPSSSPPPRIIQNMNVVNVNVQEQEEPKINYGNNPMPVNKRKILKKSLKIEEDTEVVVKEAVKEAEEAVKGPEIVEK